MTVEEIFEENKKTWNRETSYTSNVTEIIMHPSYQRIIGLGPEALPFILRSLEEEGGHWFWALRFITGEDILSEDCTYSQAVQMWLDWERERGYL